MKRKNTPSIFDALFGFDSLMSLNISMPSRFDADDFPAEDDPDYHKTEEIVSTGSHTVKKEVWTSIDGTRRFERTVSESKRTPKVSTKEDMKLLLNKAIEEEDFEKAIELRNKLRELDK